jgi:hypothetical protein
MNATGPAQIKRLALPTWIAAFSPVVALAIFVTTALHVRLALGHWPMEAVDHAPTILLGLHQLLCSITLLLGGFGAIPAWLLLLCFPSLRLGIATHLIQATVLAVGLLALFWGPTAVSPEYVSWFLD